MANVPVPFQGTKEEAQANYLTHSWWPYDGTLICGECDAKAWHQAADYPCGTEPERLTVADLSEWYALMKGEITLEELRKREKCDTMKS